MPVTEIAGDFSGFGDQISSLRCTAPRALTTKGTRTYKLHEKPFLPFQRGHDAPAVDVEGRVRHFSCPSCVHDSIDQLTSPLARPCFLRDTCNLLQSSFGTQVASRKISEPKFSIPQCPSEPLRSTTPGPGTHGTEQHMESSLNAQVRSKRVTEARCKIGTQKRFVVPSQEGHVACPGSIWPRPQTGWIGESSPQFSVNHTGRR